jgi:4-amino-4-deoxy-L-arabinose transferase-like glycosyltransferase
MLASGDWLTPHFDTLPYLDKPALFFWLEAESFRMWGLSEWAARFPSALAALATAFLTWLLAKRMFGDSAALRAGLVWATSPLVIAFARLVVFDMILTFFITLALVCFWFAQTCDFGQPWLDAGLFGAMGLATFEKGPVGFIIPLLSIAAYQAARGHLRGLGRLRWGLGLAIFAATALPWFVVISIRHPEFLRYAVWETWLRFATSRARRAGGAFYYIPVFLGGFLPWSFFLLFAAWNRLKRWRALGRDARQPELFLAVSAAVVFVFFSISQSKLPGYVLPASVPLSILMARVWDDVGFEGAWRPDWLAAGFGALVALGLLTAAAPQLLRLPSVQALAARKIPPSVMPFIRPSLFSSGVILAALGALGRNRFARRSAKTLSVPAFALLACTALLLLVRWAQPLRTYAEAFSSRQLARTVLASPQRDLPVYGYYYFRTSLMFYLRRPVGLVTAGAGETTSNYVSSQWPNLRRQARLRVGSGNTTSADAEARTAGSPRRETDLPLLIDAAELQALARPPSVSFLVMARNTHVARLVKTVGRAELLWTAWDYSVLQVPASASNGDANQRHGGEPPP